MHIFDILYRNSLDGLIWIMTSEQNSVWKPWKVSKPFLRGWLRTNRYDTSLGKVMWQLNCLTCHHVVGYEKSKTFDIFFFAFLNDVKCCHEKNLKIFDAYPLLCTFNIHSKNMYHFYKCWGHHVLVTQT